jgi:hypothetical protein
MAKQNILIIGDAEKPDSVEDKGVNAAGAPDSKSLIFGEGAITSA